MSKEVLQAEILLMIMTSIGLAITLFVVVVFLWVLWIQDLLNYIYCLFSESARYRRWNGYYGFLYTDRPLFSKRADIAIKYMKENNINVHDIKDGVLKIPREYIEPTPEELGKAFKFEWIVPGYWFMKLIRYIRVQLRG